MLDPQGPEDEDKDSEDDRVARKAKGMRRVVFWGPKVFEATGSARLGGFGSSVVEQLPQ